jgi:hypothetical protein
MHELSNEEIKRLAPAAFTVERHPKRTDRYQPIDTMEVVQFMKEHGYFVAQAGQDKARLRDPNFVRHKLVLMHEDVLAGKTRDTVPQIYLMNSHNGRTKFRMFAGFYRFVCENGLVVGTDLARIEMAHTGDVKGEVKSSLEVLRDATDEATGRIDRWRATEMPRAKVLDFGKKALELRFGEERAKGFDLDSLLKAKRNDDEGNHLWEVFNRVQEKLVTGGVEGLTANNRAVVSRGLGDINRTTVFNRDLWALADKYAKAA